MKIGILLFWPNISNTKILRSHTLHLLSSIILSQTKKIHIYTNKHSYLLLNEMGDYPNVDWNPIVLAKYFEYKNSSISHTASPILYHPIPNEEENLSIHIPINIAQHFCTNNYNSSSSLLKKSRTKHNLARIFVNQRVTKLRVIQRRKQGLKAARRKWSARSMVVS